MNSLVSKDAGKAEKSASAVANASEYVLPVKTLLSTSERESGPPMLIAVPSPTNMFWPIAEFVRPVREIAWLRPENVQPVIDGDAFVADTRADVPLNVEF